MELRFTKSFEVEYKKIIKGNFTIKNQVEKQLLILQTNINHPSLRLHKLVGKKYWSISINRSVRVLLLMKLDIIYVFHIGKHEDVY